MASLTGEVYYFCQQPGSPGWPQQLLSLVILMSEFLMSRPVFLQSGKDCFKLSIAVFRFGCSAAHITLLLCINTVILVYHVSEYCKSKFDLKKYIEKVQSP
jgi:hypothetical protein